MVEDEEEDRLSGQRAGRAWGINKGRPPTATWGRGGANNNFRPRQYQFGRLDHPTAGRGVTGVST